MMYTIVISKEAENDLREIYEYIAFQLLSPDIASGQLDRLEKAIQSLSDMPCRFREYQNRKWRKRRLRIMPVDNYCVFYIFDDTKQMVIITRIIYGARNFPTVLNDGDT